MSYARVNTSSDSEDDASSIPTSPSAHVRRTGSAAAASLASLAKPDSHRGHGYSQLSGSAIGEEDSTQNNAGEDAAAIDLQEQDKADSENDIEIHVRFGEGQDLKLRVPREDTIAQVKEKVKQAKKSVGDKYMRLIHSGKILSDERTLIESLPKSLFTQIEVPHPHHDFHDLQSRLSSSVEAVEAAASNILAGISSRASGGDKAIDNTQSNSRTHTSLGSILPTHVTYSSSSSNHADSNTTPVTAPPAIPDPLSPEDNRNHISINMPTESPSISNNNPNSRSGKHQDARSAPTIKIPVQTGPIYFLCSLSDFPPTQPPSNVKKGKAVVIGNSSSSGNARSSRTARNRQHIPSQSASAAASSPLTLAGRSNVSSNGEGSSSSNARAMDGVAEEHYRVEEDEDEDGVEGEEELSPTMAPQATGFDRLREAGFSEDEIRSIRRQFHASRETMASSVGENGIAIELDQDEDSRARARRIEEEWIDQHGAETLPEGLEGSYGEMVWGLMLGFFMGLMALFWFKEATFSRRQQMGIIAGLMINIGFGCLHLYY
ncbi:hypothetical protein BGX21_007498 [Mortierella sp. AD011]|nr:hypothetical protein BGX20_007864 [Mortierella sp. AD010]KAF9403031.1 hypothetical protein BGX21_007498 [Mortierella sp. AD011]